MSRIYIHKHAKTTTMREFELMRKSQLGRFSDFVVHDCWIGLIVSCINRSQGEVD